MWISLTTLNGLSADDFKPLEEELKRTFKLNTIPERSFDQVIEGALVTSESDFVKKSKNKNYYECQAASIMYQQ